MSPIQFNPATSEITVSGAPLALWHNTRRYLCLDSAMSWLLPRAIFLRALGIIGLLAFLSWGTDTMGLIGPDGIWPVWQYLGMSVENAGTLGKFFGEPTLFWLSTAPWMIYLVVWGGCVASTALALNVFPRGATVIAWMCWISLVAIPIPPARCTPLERFTAELLFLAIFVAPKGFRPGLGASSPPSRPPIFVLRISLLKLMLVSGLSKFFSGDPLWRSFTAMDHMVETAPFPSLIGFYLHHLPHAYHVGETCLMIGAEIISPLLLIFGGPRAKVFALATWVLFQAGIAVSASFGWLNLTAVVLAVVILDDDFLRRYFRRVSPATSPTTRPALSAVSRIKAWLVIALMSLSLISSVVQSLPIFFGVGPDFPDSIKAVAQFLSPAMIGVPLSIYSQLSSIRPHALIEGSNDGGKTWRAYRYRILPQDLEALAPYNAPFAARFDAIIYIVEGGAAWNSGVLQTLSPKLLGGRPEILALFRENPFPDRPPDSLRIGVFEYSFVDLETHRKTGNIWTRKYIGEPFPTLHLNRDSGAIY